MTKLQQIEKSVEELSDEEMKSFAAWFEELRWQRWDRQIELDSESGKLDRIIKEARAEIAQGKTTPL